MWEWIRPALASPGFVPLRFVRTNIGIPESVDADKIEATIKKGLLKITLPKKAEA